MLSEPLKTILNEVDTIKGFESFSSKPYRAVSYLSGCLSMAANGRIWVNKFEVLAWRDLPPLPEWAK